MENPGLRLLAVLIVNVVIWLMLKLAHRRVPVLNRHGDSGIYLILLPLGFGLFGMDLPYWSTAPIICGGLAILLNSLRGAAAAERPAKEGSVPRQSG